MKSYSNNYLVKYYYINLFKELTSLYFFAVSTAKDFIVLKFLIYFINFLIYYKFKLILTS